MTAEAHSALPSIHVQSSQGTNINLKMVWLLITNIMNELFNRDWNLLPDAEVNDRRVKSKQM